MSTPPTIPQPAKSGGKKWILFGCGGCLGLIVLGCVVIGFIMMGIMKTIKSSDCYTQALAPAVAHPAVQEALGTPVKDSFFVTGSVNVTNNTGDATLIIPITGPKGGAAVTYRGTRDASGWHPTLHTVLIGNTNQTIDLLKSAVTPALTPAPGAAPQAPAPAAPAPEAAPAPVKDAASAIKDALKKSGDDK